MSITEATVLARQKGYRLTPTERRDEFRLIGAESGIPQLKMPEARLYFTLAEARSFLEGLPDRTANSDGGGEVDAPSP